MSGRGELRVSADPEALGRAAAELFAKVVRTAVDRQGRCSVLLAGGATPRRTYQLLAVEPWASGIPWPQVHFFWGDERCLPVGDPQRNETMARLALIDRVDVARGQVHPIDCAGSPEAAATSYAAQIATFFHDQPPCFDLALLGLGDDGHIASLLPGSAALAEARQWTAVARRPEEAFFRVTLTAPLLNQARLVVFLVSGSSKARVLRAGLTGADPALPVHLIRPAGELLWLVDRDAAALLGTSHASE